VRVNAYRIEEPSTPSRHLSVELDMHEFLIALMVLPPLLMVIAMLAMYAQLRRFQRLVPVLRGPDDLARFQRLATIQMIVALSEPVLFWLPLIIWPIGHFFIGDLTWLDLLLFGVIPFCIVAIVAFSTIGTARAVRATPTSSTELEAGRDRIVDIWLNRWLPRF
jgi:hypothetical protein